MLELCRCYAHLVSRSGNENRPQPSQCSSADAALSDQDFCSVVTSPLPLQGFTAINMIDYFVFRQLEAGIQADYKGMFSDALLQVRLVPLSTE